MSEPLHFYPTGTPAPVAMDPGELPSSYGKNRLVLLAVDPYLIYSYWELAADPLPTAGSRQVLRFHESTDAGGQSRPFDIEIDFGAGNWYVPLWSAGKFYRAELGLRAEDGGFVLLAASNQIRTPQASPIPAEEPPPVADVVCLPEEPVVEPVAETVAEEIEIPAEAAIINNVGIDTAGHLQRRLAELFAIRGELPAMPEPYYVADLAMAGLDGFEEELPIDLLPFDLGKLDTFDLTQYSENRFVPGISSEGGPLGR